MITERIPLWEGRDDVALYTMLRHCTPNPMIPVEAEPLPAVIVCPGGAYMFCSMENEGDEVALSFAKAGYQTFILQYTVAPCFKFLYKRKTNVAFAACNYI